jgi:glucose/arabinose dehydrogenase
MRTASLALALSLLLVACGDGREPSATPDGTANEVGSLDFGNVETIAGGLEVPWELAFVDERTILVTERPGRVRVIEDGRLREEPVAEIDVRAEGEAGLLGLALHPEFPEERFAYVYYTDGEQNRVSRFPLDDSLRFGAQEIVIDEIPAGPIHDGGRIAFGPDDMLYVGTGDAGGNLRAADRESLAGKILRITPDGDVPDDNPFDGSPVYSYGHRNVQGLDWDAEGRLYASEHGPTGEFGLRGHDEVNAIEAGSFYGWPFRVGMDAGADGSPPAEPVDPLVTSGTQTWAPAGLAVHQGSLLVANLRGERLMTIDLAEPDTPSTAVDGFGRLRAVRLGPDECLYMTTSNTDSRGSPQDNDDRVLRVCPQA